MNEQFVPYDIAVSLKEKGFNDPCIGYFWREKLYICENQNGVLNPPRGYDDIPAISAPLWQQAIDWLRNNFKIMICLDFYSDNNIEYHYKISEPNTWDECDIFVESGFKKYEDARKVSIMKALTLINNNE